MDKLPVAQVSQEYCNDPTIPVATEVTDSTEPQMPPPPVPTYDYDTPSAPPAIDEMDEMTYECPVCFDSIHPSSAAMRCDGSGGHAHYFHAHCLNQWARTCQQQNHETNCPVCRGGVQVHAQRLEQFLATTTDDDVNTTLVGRRLLSSLIPESIRDGWAAVPVVTDLTREELVEGASIVAGAGIGFWSGARGSNLSTGNWYMDANLWEQSSTATKVSTVVGYTAGLVYRWWSSASAGEEEEEEERRRRRRR